ncbi:hypothetical protein CVT26_004877 [Gymnopilus dilepis]|uniref:Uncharacterized protein n=1 Tax=Gymnopilus dilepis TaxID=231916 RepID=A0A409WZ70_9AGAR|nr:hypothetical protein CVT26_004877 [Gymnopilus dilepis]
MFYRFLADPSQVPTDLLPASFSSTEPALPSLEIFDCAGYKPPAWETIVGLVKPISATGVLHRRPLKSVKVHCIEIDGPRAPYIPKDVIQQLVELVDVKFKFTIDLCMSQQGIRVDWWQASVEGMKDA